MLGDVGPAPSLGGDWLIIGLVLVVAIWVWYEFVLTPERAKVSASVTVLGRLAQALHVDPCELIRASQRR